MASQGTNRVLNLPAEVAESHVKLHSVAARIFRAGPVRSVTVDCARSVAVVRLYHETNENADFDFEAPVRPLPSDQAAVTDTEQVQPVELVSWTDPRDGTVSFIKAPPRVHGWRKALYLALAAAALGLGFLGILLPGLPTTPFVLLGSYFLVRSSTHLHKRLITSRLFGGVLRDWHLHRGLKPHVRARAVAVVAMVVLLSLFITRSSWPVMLGIVALAACGLTVIWRLPTAREA